VKVYNNFGKVEINSKPYRMLGIHYHSPSEHFIDGEQFDLEMHFVGQSNSGSYQVVALMFSKGKESNPFIQATIDKFESVSNTTFDSSFLICNGLLDDYFHYLGSLTAPIGNHDCLEDVKWTIIRKPLEISESQLNFFTSRWQGNQSFAGGRGNNRKLQNLNNRTVWFHEANFVSNKFCSAKKCPKIECSAEVNQACYSVKNNSHTISECGENSYCPDVSIQTASNQTCSSKDSSFVERQERISGTSQSSCYNLYDCDQGFYCSEGTCKVKKGLESECESLYECEDGYVCNLGRCSPYFSVEQGQPANSSLACASAIVLDGICQPSQKTNGLMPKACDSDKDCLASDGVTPGTCSCVFDLNGLSYCKLHRSDPDMVNLLVAAHEGKNDLARFYARLVNFYPIHLFADQCFKRENFEMKGLESANDTRNRENGMALMFGFIWMMI
jgi:hypothetical protein